MELIENYKLLNSSLTKFQNIQIENLKKIIQKKDPIFLINKLKITFHSLHRSYALVTVNEKNLHISKLTSGRSS